MLDQPAQPIEQWRIDYDIDSSDVVAFNLFHSQSSPSVRRTRRVLFLMIAFGAMLVVVQLLVPTRTNKPRSFVDDYMVPLAICSVPIYILVRWRGITTRRVNKLLSEGINRNLVGRRTLILMPDVVTETWLLGKTALKWAAFERVEATESHLFLFQSAISATLVPRRAFNSQTEFDAFVEAARRLHHAASPGFCKGCNYDLVGIKSSQCPECGRPIPTPDN